MAELGSGEAKPVKIFTEKAVQIGIGYDALKDMKQKLGVNSIREGKNWYWGF